MKVLEYLISKTGTLIYPTTISYVDTDKTNFNPMKNQITCSFYDDIQTSSTGIITPIDPVITGLGGNLVIQGRPTDNSAWSNIQDGTLHLADGDNMVFPSGVIRSLKATCESITGCEYILIRMDRGI